MLGRLCGFAGLALGLWLSGAVAAAPKRIGIADIANIVRVSDPQLSPDGKSIVAVVSRPNIREARYDRSLLLIDVGTGTQRALTYERRGVSNPRWSPAGDRIAFLDASAVDSQPEMSSGTS